MIIKRIFLIFTIFVGLIDSQCSRDFSVEPDSAEQLDNLAAKPIIKKSSVNYSRATFRIIFPDTAYLNNINRAYSDNYSEDLRNRLVEYMKGEVKKIGEDEYVFDNLLSKTGCKQVGAYLLPVYAERAKFEAQKAWIFQMTYGLGGPNFGHFRRFAFGLANLDTLAYLSCK